MEFVNKEYFILLTLLIPYIIWYWRNRKHSEPTMRVSTVVAYYKASKSWRQRIVHTPMFLRCLAFVMIVCVMARPQTRNSWDNKSVEGIDIMLAMDVSTSMLAEDLKAIASCVPGSRSARASAAGGSHGGPAGPSPSCMGTGF